MEDLFSNGINLAFHLRLYVVPIFSFFFRNLLFKGEGATERHEIQIFLLGSKRNVSNNEASCRENSNEIF